MPGFKGRETLLEMWCPLAAITRRERGQWQEIRTWSKVYMVFHSGKYRSGNMILNGRGPTSGVWQVSRRTLLKPNPPRQMADRPVECILMGSMHPAWPRLGDVRWIVGGPLRNFE